MAALEDAVQSLNGALDALEARLEERLGDLAHQGEAIEAARRQAQTARLHAGVASDGLADAIGELKALIDDGRED